MIFSHVEAEICDVAVLHDVIFSFQANETFVAGGSDGAELNQVVVVHNFRANETAFDVTVNFSGSP